MDLPACHHRFDVGKPDRVGCTSLKLLHQGTVPIGVCQVCPYATVEPGEQPYTPVAPGQPCAGCGPVKRRGVGDLVSDALGAVGITKERVQAVASLVGIEDCGCLERQNKLNELFPFSGGEQLVECSTQFVWVYWHGGANGDEIRWSVRSVEKFFRGKAAITIVGDRPPWYTGHLIHKPRIKTRPAHGFRDTASKIHTICLHPEIRDKFVWMMDDVYLMKPVSLQELEQPRAVGYSKSRKNLWLRIKGDTMAELVSRGLPTHDYATHLPHVVEKEKLKTLVGMYNLTRELRLWEVLYGNTFRKNPIRVTPFFCRIRNPLKYNQYRHLLRNVSVMNHVAGAWCPGIRQYLMNLLPDRSLTETDVPVDTKFRMAARPGRVVKRRPKHTHRAYIEQQQRLLEATQ